MAERWKADMDGILLYVRMEIVSYIGTTHLSKTLFLDGYLLRYRCRVPRRKLQATQARSWRDIRKSPSAGYTATRCNLQWDSPACPGG